MFTLVIVCNVVVPSKAYYALDDTEREVLRRERRRLQEQLRRVKRNEVRYSLYEKQQMLLEIQQKNLALIQSSRTAAASMPSSMGRPQSILSCLELSLSDEDNSCSSASSTMLR